MKTLIRVLAVLILCVSCSPSRKMVMPNNCTKRVKQPKYKMVEPTYSGLYIRPSNSGGNLIVTQVKQ
jgi:hypothetical protein